MRIEDRAGVLFDTLVDINNNAVVDRAGVMKLKNKATKVVYECNNTEPSECTLGLKTLAELVIKSSVETLSQRDYLTALITDGVWSKVFATI